MATTESISRTEMTLAPSLYRRAQRSSKTGCNNHCMRFLRKAKRKPVLHMALFFLLITISVIVILVVVLTTWPELEKEFSEVNATRYGYEDTALFRIPNQDTEEMLKNVSDIRESEKLESKEVFDDSLQEESNNRQDSVDVDTEDADNNPSIEYASTTNFEDELLLMSNESNVDLNMSLGLQYQWNIDPVSSPQSSEREIYSKSFYLDSDQDNDEKSSAVTGLDIRIDSDLPTLILKKQINSEPSQLHIQPTTQVSAILTLTNNLKILPNEITSINSSIDWQPNVATQNVINSTELSKEYVVSTELPMKLITTLKASIVEMDSVVNSTVDNNIPSLSNDSQTEYNFWSSLANLSLIQFPFLMSSQYDLSSESQSESTTTPVSSSDVDHTDTESNYTIRYIIKISSTQNGRSVTNMSTDKIMSTLTSSEAEYNHWPTIDDYTSVSDNPITTTENEEILTSDTSTIQATKTEYRSDREPTPSEVEFFPSTSTETSNIQTTSSGLIREINSTLVSGWGFNTSEVPETQEEISSENSLQTKPQTPLNRVTPEEQQCRQRTLSFCDDVSSYNLTYLPNLAGASTEFEKWQLISYYNSVVDWGCNPWLKEYLCYILEPMCVDEVAVPPCNSLCKAAKKGCEKYIIGSPSLESVFRCEVFPSATAQVLCAGLGNGEACKQNEFRCSDTTCIPGTWWCDGVMDCEQGDDEKECQPRNKNL